MSAPWHLTAAEMDAAWDEREARLAEAERSIDTLLGMIRHQRDVLRECLPYLNESMAGRRPGRSADDIRASVKALTADSASDALQKFASDLADAQRPLDPEVARVLYENKESLYMTDADQPEAAVK